MRIPFQGIDRPYLRYFVNDVDLQPIPDKLETMVIYEDISPGTNTHKIQLIDVGNDFIENEAIIQGGGKIRYQFGWMNGERSEFLNARLIEYAPVFLTSGTSVHIIGGDPSLFINRGIKSRSFRNQKISDIVIQIARDNGFEDDFILVEETEGTFPALRQLNESDVQFIKHRLLRRAVTKGNKRGDYNFYFTGNGEFHFHTPDFNQEIYDSYTFGGVQQSVVRKFIPRFNGEMVNALGGLDVKVTGYDPIEKQDIVTRLRVDDASTQDKELLAPKTIETNLPKGSQSGRYYSVPFHDRFEVDGWAKNMFFLAQRLRYTANMEVIGDPNIKPGLQIEMELLNAKTGSPHYTSGRYLIESVKHIINGSHFTSHLVLSRNGALRGEESLTGKQRPSVVMLNSPSNVERTSEALE